MPVWSKCACEQISAARVQAVFLEQIRQAAAVKLGIARVEEDNVAVVELIDGDEGGRRLSHIGFPVYMARFIGVRAFLS